MTAQEHLDELKRAATAQLKATKLAARNEGLELVDGKRLAQLERIVDLLKESMKTAKQTRSYQDVQTETDRYNGKRWLFQRHEFDEIARLLCDLEPRVSLPGGCFADDQAWYVRTKGERGPQA